MKEMNKNYKIRYFKIYKKIDNTLSELFCITCDEDLAIQFCEDNPSYYYTIVD